MKPQRRPAPRAVPVVDRSGHRIQRPRAADAPGVRPDKRTPAVGATPVDQVEARFKSLSRQEQIVAAITAHVDHVKRQNSPEIIEKLSETEFWRFILDESLRNAQLIDDGSDPRIILRGVSVRELRTAWQAVRQLAPKTIASVTQPKMPNRDPWWAFVKDLRRGAGS